jgi:hypothetical protein
MAAKPDKMDEEELLHHLQVLEEDSSTFTWGRLGSDREKGMKEYYRMPYGTEEEGRSDIVTSEVQDTIEWILPDLLDIFVSTDKAVCFEPTEEKDVKGAEQATDACNYIFYKRNNGFLVLYTAFKDALMVKNCAVHWRNEEKRVKTVVPVNGATEDEITMVLAESGDDAEIESQQELPPQPMMMPQMGPNGQPIMAPAVGPDGQPMMMPPRFNARICKTEKRKSICVEAFAPENLLIKRDWTSPILSDCPYVCRNMPISLSELWEMGFDDVKPEELRESDDAGVSADMSFRANRAGTTDQAHDAATINTDADESQTQGFLRIEYVLVDFDGDGIAERRCIYRLKQRILSNDEASHVPFATASPILIQHRWDGMSVAEMVSDLQKLRTEWTRQMVDSGRLAMNPKTKVLTDSNWSPQANIDDLLDPRPGWPVRMLRPDAVSEMASQWTGTQMFPMLEYMDSMLAKRTGVSGQSQGIDANALNRGGKYEMRVMNSAQKRIKLIARVFAEILVKPMFQGILKLLTDGDMEKISMRLRNEFVQYDPSEWRDNYDMTANVGLGTGDREYQAMVLEKVATSQAQLAMSPFGKLLITPKNVYNSHARMIEYAGFKNVGDFFVDPGDKLPEPLPPPPPPPQVMIKQMELAADAHKYQAEQAAEQQKIALDHQAKIMETRAQLELQAQNDMRDAERERMKAEHTAQLEDLKAQLEKYRIDEDNRTKIMVAEISHPPAPEPDADDGNAEHNGADVAKDVQIIRGADGKMARIIVKPMTQQPLN